MRDHLDTIMRQETDQTGILVLWEGGSHDHLAETQRLTGARHGCEDSGGGRGCYLFYGSEDQPVGPRPLVGKKELSGNHEKIQRALHKIPYEVKKALFHPVEFTVRIFSHIQCPPFDANPLRQYLIVIYQCLLAQVGRDQTYQLHSRPPSFKSSSLLKKAYLPSAGLGAPLRPDAIQSSYARQTADSTSVLRFPLPVRCIGPSSSSLDGGAPNDRCIGRGGASVAQ